MPIYANQSPISLQRTATYAVSICLQTAFTICLKSILLQHDCYEIRFSLNATGYHARFSSSLTSQPRCLSLLLTAFTCLAVSCVEHTRLAYRLIARRVALLSGPCTLTQPSSRSVRSASASRVLLRSKRALARVDCVHIQGHIQGDLCTHGPRAQTGCCEGCAT